MNSIRMKRGLEKKGLSPVVATVLLIAIVVVLALIIFLWARGFVSEKTQKFKHAIELECENVDFTADYNNADGEVVGVVNQGNVPMYGVVVKEIGIGSVNVVNVKEPFGNSLSVGESKEITLNSAPGSNTEALLIVPILLGESSSQRKTHTCDDAFGYVIPIST